MSKFETQNSNYKQDTEFIILCFVNKAQILSFFFTYSLYWCKFHSNVTFFLLAPVALMASRADLPIKSSFFHPM